jgi:hypothetical protein
MPIFTRGKAKIDVLAHVSARGKYPSIDFLVVTSRFNSSESSAAELFEDVQRRYLGTQWNPDWGKNYDDLVQQEIEDAGRG